MKKAERHLQATKEEKERDMNYIEQRNIELREELHKVKSQLGSINYIENNIGKKLEEIQNQKQNLQNTYDCLHQFFKLYNGDTLAKSEISSNQILQLVDLSQILKNEIKYAQVYNMIDAKCIKIQSRDYDLFKKSFDANDAETAIKTLQNLQHFPIYVDCLQHYVNSITIQLNKVQIDYIDNQSFKQTYQQFCSEVVSIFVSQLGTVQSKLFQIFQDPNLGVKQLIIEIFEVRIKDILKFAMRAHSIPISQTRHNINQLNMLAECFEQTQQLVESLLIISKQNLKYDLTLILNQNLHNLFYDAKRFYIQDEQICLENQLNQNIDNIKNVISPQNEQVNQVRDRRDRRNQNSVTRKKSQSPSPRQRRQTVDNISKRFFQKQIQQPPVEETSSSILTKTDVFLKSLEVIKGSIHRCGILSNTDDVSQNKCTLITFAQDKLFSAFSEIIYCKLQSQTLQMVQAFELISRIQSIINIYMDFFSSFKDKNWIWQECGNARKKHSKRLDTNQESIISYAINQVFEKCSAMLTTQKKQDYFREDDRMNTDTAVELSTYLNELLESIQSHIQTPKSQSIIRTICLDIIQKLQVHYSKYSIHQEKAMLLSSDLNLYRSVLTVTQDSKIKLEFDKLKMLTNLQILPAHGLEDYIQEQNLNQIVRSDLLKAYIDKREDAKNQKLVKIK